MIGKTGQLARSILASVDHRNISIVCEGRPSLDLSLPENIEAMLRDVSPDIVINAAAYTDVDGAEKEPENAFRVNATGPENAALAAAALGLPIIHISTDYVFDGTKAGVYFEHDSVAPLGIYGQSKLKGERLLAAANPKHIILRTAWLFSPYGKNFVKTMLRLAQTRRELRVVDDQHGCPTYAPDLAAAILDLAQVLLTTERISDRWGIYHACGGGETTWYGFSREVFDQAQRLGLAFSEAQPITSKDFPTLASRPKNSTLSCEKLKTRFGICLPQWKTGVERCVLALAKDAERKV